MTTTISSEALDVIVVGAGQAGLAVAYHLAREGAHFLILDAGGRASGRRVRRPHRRRLP